MKTTGILLLSASILFAQETPDSREHVTARGKVLELASAFSNDGFKLRDGHWSGVIEPGKPQLLKVNLFSGNAYWFSAATPATAGKLTVGIYDENGRPVEGNVYQDGTSAAAGVLPDASGQYFVRVELVEGDKADFCLVYSYK